MDKTKHKIMLRRGHKPPISELNSGITCKLCKGYFIDATTIIECLHTFCRSCIVRYLESNKYCPICDVQVHKTKPLLNIRQDKTIQDLVYKLVPRLYQNEIKRRKVFYETHPAAKPTITEQNMITQYNNILTPEELIDFTMNYYGCSIPPRYLRCSCAVTTSHLKRLIYAKFDLTERHKVEVLFNEDVLDDSLSLMDIAYIYSWKKKEPLNLSYKIYECGVKKPRLNCEDGTSTVSSNNNNNWKEVQLRISENGEMSITGIKDSNMLNLLEETEKFKSEIVINESKHLDEDSKSEVSSKGSKDQVDELIAKKTPEGKKELPDLKFIGKTNNANGKANVNSVSKLNASALKEEKAKEKLCDTISNGEDSFTITLSSDREINKANATVPKTIEFTDGLNLNSELSLIPLNSHCASFSNSSGTTMVFSTINKSMCSTKPSSETTTRTNASEKKEGTTSNDIKQSNILKRKGEDLTKTIEVPSKLPKPTILNHSIGLMNLSNSHPLKKHSKLSRNGERRPLDVNDKMSLSNTNVTVSHATPKSVDNNTNKPIIINKNLNYLHVNKNKVNSVPCYMPKTSGKSNGENDEGVQQKLEGPLMSKHLHSYQNAHHTAIITPSQLPHHQHMNSLQHRAKDEENSKAIDINSAINTNTESSGNGTLLTTVKPKPSTPLGYKTLRDPPKSWNSQINSQIAKVNQNVKAQQMANLAASSQTSGTPNKGAGDLKNVRPAKFFKGRNMPRYLGNPASGVKPMYQVHVSPEKEKNQDAKTEKSEIKKHSIVKIDPKTLKPISEKAPETSNLSVNVSTTQSGQELRLNPTTGDLKINTSSVSIFNPLKLQQNSPKCDRRSPKSPHSPKIKSTLTVTTSTSSTSASTTALSPKQQRDKTSLTFTPPNPFIPNLASPTVNPNQFLYPATGFPTYDPRFMAACHSLWYTQRMAAAAAAGLVPSALPHGFGLNIGLPSPPSPQSHSSGASKHSPVSKATAAPKINNSQQHSPSQTTKSMSTVVTSGTKKSKESPSAKNDKSLETALEKLTQNKTKELNENSDKKDLEIVNGSHSLTTNLAESKVGAETPNVYKEENKVECTEVSETPMEKTQLLEKSDESKRPQELNEANSDNFVSPNETVEKSNNLEVHNQSKTEDSSVKIETKEVVSEKKSEEITRQNTNNRLETVSGESDSLKVENTNADQIQNDADNKSDVPQKCNEKTDDKPSSDKITSSDNKVESSVNGDLSKEIVEVASEKLEKSMEVSEENKTNKEDNAVQDVAPTVKCMENSENANSDAGH
ncbi:hypothetical protein ABEB36_007821 [Hypothenemus hampei]|uniref:RING-type domain-containing protein n=1 Tax=Hypothenemus hampei TaxID=57062 RepID=A0ABD1EV97_HYPHA